MQVFNIGGKPRGFLLPGYPSSHKVVVLDLNVFLATAATNGVANSDRLS